jgi:DNA-binding LacI/PurR family transcriptional regulator
MSVTIQDVANVSGFSIATVSRVLNNTNYPVSSRARQRIAEAAEALGYRPNLAARSLRTDRSSTVGIIADDVTCVFTPLIIRGIQDHLNEAGYLCVIINADWDPAAEQSAIHDLISRSIDGVLFVESWHRSANETLDLAQKPCVFAHRQFAAPNPYSVRPDEVYGAQLAVGHLIRLGHREIGYINGPAHYYASAERLQGYQLELDKAGIPFDPALVADGDWSVESGYRAMQTLLEREIRPTALFAANDLMAVGAIYAMADANLRVPEDIAVVGYDDREIATIFRPALTTVTLPCYEMGHASARMLLNLLEGAQESGDEVRIRGRLIVRDSCGTSRLPSYNQDEHGQTQPLLSYISAVKRLNNCENPKTR